VLDGVRAEEGGVVPLTPLGRRAHVSEISGAIAYLAGADSSFLTGTELIIDGGPGTLSRQGRGSDSTTRRVQPATAEAAS